MSSRTYKSKFPAQLVIMVSRDAADRIRDEAEASGESIGSVARKYINLGMSAGKEVAS